MRKIFLFITITIGLMSVELKAQWGQYNFADDFSGTRTICTGNSMLFPDNAFPNWRWGWTHGTPSGGAGGVILQNNNGMGQGMFTNIHFHRDTKYIITIGVNSFTTNSAILSRIHVCLSNAHNNLTCNPSASEPIGPVTSELLLLNQLTGNLPATTFFISFRTPSNQDFDAINIFPVDLDPNNSQQVELIVRCVKVQGCGEDKDLIFDNTIPNGDILSNTTRVGSSLGSSSTLVANSTISSTTLTAAQFIEFVPNTLISANENSLLATIKGCNSLVFGNDADFPLQPIITTQNGGSCIATVASQRILGTQQSTDEDNELFKVYPNPAFDYINVSNKFDNPFKIQLYSTQGKLLLQQASNEKISTLDIHTLSKGIYFLKLIDVNNNLFTKTIIKE